MKWSPPANESELIKPYEEHIRCWENQEAFTFSIIEKLSKKLIGRISIRLSNSPEVWDIGFWTHPIYQNKGYMTETVKHIVAFGFDKLKAKSITADHTTWNIASQRILLTNGFKHCGTNSNGFKKNGEWIEVQEYLISK